MLSRLNVVRSIQRCCSTAVSMHRKNYYAILGIPENALYGQIRTAYNKLASKYDPDKFRGHEYTINHIKEFTEAYLILSNKTTKMAYDKGMFYDTPETSSIFNDELDRLTKTRKRLAKQELPQEDPFEYDPRVSEVNVWATQIYYYRAMVYANWLHLFIAIKWFIVIVFLGIPWTGRLGREGL